MDTIKAKGDVQSAVRGAVEVPLGVLSKAPVIAEMALALVERGMQTSLSDAGVAAAAAVASATGAYYNVMINLPEIQDENYREKITEEADKLFEKTREVAGTVHSKIVAKLKNES